MKVEGHLTGLKSAQSAKLARLFRRRVPAGQLLSHELAEQMVEASHEMARSIAVLVNRAGHVTNVIVGGANQLEIPALKKREAAARLSGWRAILVHPGGGPPSRDELVALAMNRLDAMVTIDALPKKLHEGEVWFASLLVEADAKGALWAVEDLTYKAALNMDFDLWLEELEAGMAEAGGSREVEGGQERAILIGVQTPDLGDRQAKESIEELAQLARTAGAAVLHTSIQKRQHPDPATHLGSGKVDELALRSRELNATLIVVDTELSPSQQRKLEEAFGLKVLDRTALILDIFAQRAQTKEGKLQVELAQLKYLLPRLRGASHGLSQQGGGIGTRGPGETKLETDKRRINTRVAHLENEVEHIKTHRNELRKRRRKQELVQVALVGYTNAGKSTLLNRLTKSEVLAEDKLFATLDPVTRKLRLPGGGTVLLTDTVGFIQRLPTQLVAAFRATLEEVTAADVLLHVVDASHPNVDQHLAAVELVLRELGAGDKAILTVLNKCDVADKAALAKLHDAVEHPVEISALSGEGLMDLLALVESEARLDEPVAGEPAFALGDAP